MQFRGPKAGRFLCCFLGSNLHVCSLCRRRCQQASFLRSPLCHQQETTESKSMDLAGDNGFLSGGHGAIQICRSLWSKASGRAPMAAAPASLHGKPLQVCTHLLAMGLQTTASSRESCLHLQITLLLYEREFWLEASPARQAVALVTAANVSIFAVFRGFPSLRGAMVGFRVPHTHPMHRYYPDTGISQYCIDFKPKVAE